MVSIVSGLAAWVVAAGIALALGASSVAAQTRTPATTAPEVRTDDRLRTLERAGEAEGSEPDAAVPAPVDYADVLANPDDIALNLAYARQQIAAGELKGASATLQRVLFVAPDAASVRALYGIVLFRLGDLAGAERALGEALDSGLDAPTAAQARRYLDLAETGQRRTTGSLSLTAGAVVDSNRNAAPTDGRALFRDIPVRVDGGEGDVAGLGVAQAQVRHDLGSQAGHALYAEGTLFAQEQNRRDEYDLQVGTAEAGVELAFGALTLRPGLGGATYRLGGDPYLHSGRLALEAAYRLRPDLRLAFEGASLIERFRDTPSAPAAEEQDGWRHTGRLALTWNTQSLAVEGALAVTRKMASADYKAYVGVGPEVAVTLLLGAGQFLLAEVGGEARRYDAADPFVSATPREDGILRLGLTYGLPLSSVFGEALPQALGAVNLLLSTEALIHDSNLANYDYTNEQARVLLSRRFRF